MDAIERRRSGPYVQSGTLQGHLRVETKDIKEERTVPCNWAWRNTCPHYDWMDRHFLPRCNDAAVLMPWLSRSRFKPPMRIGLRSVI